MDYEPDAVPEEMKKFSPEEERILRSALNKCVCKERYGDPDTEYLLEWNCPKHGEVRRFMYGLGDHPPFRIENHPKSMFYCPRCGRAL